MESTENMSRGNMLSGAEAMVRMLQAYDVKHILVSVATQLCLFMTR